MIKHLIILLISALSVLAETKPYWVFLEAGLDATPVILTPQAEQRLARRGSIRRAGDHAVNSEYLKTLRQAGYQIRRVSRFLNAVSINVENTSRLDQLSTYPFIQEVIPVAKRRLDLSDQPTSNDLLSRTSEQDYGNSYPQNQMLNIPLLHDYGYDGGGVLIGVFDTGFNTAHPVFDNMHIMAQYDFVEHQVDVGGYGYNHGTNVLSILGGYTPGELIGPAYGASFLLACTEDLRSETTAEEDNWVAAMEWADSLGVDIITTSLNYREFDDPNDNYTASDMDGQTAIITRAANVAASRGILVVNSAGNEGPGEASIWPPSDSPHVLSVGSVNSEGNISPSSSQGPTYDGRIKPDVVARGSSTYLASGTDSYGSGNGTSFAAPQIAGLAALLLQAHPELTPGMLISRFHENSNRSLNPDNTYGYGIPDLSPLFPKMLAPVGGNCMVYPNPGRGGEIRMVLEDAVANLIEEATLYDIRGRSMAILRVKAESSRVLRMDLPTNLPLYSQLMILSVDVAGNQYSGKFVYLR